VEAFGRAGAGQPPHQSRDAYPGRGELFTALTRELIRLHKENYGRGATRARAMFPQPNLLLVEMEDLFLTMEHTLVEKGHHEIVREARHRFQAAMREEFIGVVESLTGREVENYESVTFTDPGRVLEIFYLVPESPDGPPPAPPAYPPGD
jgi:uncharacterized protein YbcI